MAWIPGNFGSTGFENINEQVANLKGHLTQEEARVWLAKWLKFNPGIAYSVVTGGEQLFPFQVILSRMIMARDFTCIVASRGYSKTFSSAVNALLMAIFDPGIKIALLGPSFRQAKEIFKYIEEIRDKPNASILKSIINTSKVGDEWSISIGQSKIFALPLGNSGGKVRGKRCNVLIIDEFLEMPKEVVGAILTPFLAVKRDPMNRERIRRLEDKAIENGILSEEDRWVFPNQKMIISSSAGFKFQYLYEVYQEYYKYITDPEFKDSKIGYGLFQMPYHFAPEEYLDRALIEGEKLKVSDSIFKREYLAQFADDSSGYFSMIKMENLTLRVGAKPFLKLEGGKGKEYIMAIDSNYKDNENSDHFAICVIELSEDRQKYTVVHQFAIAGFNLSDRAYYIHYLLKQFNIVYCILDEAGAEQLLQYCNGSGCFVENSLRLDLFDSSFEKSDNYEVGLLRARNSHKVSTGNIVHRQYFDSKWIALANESLQTSFDRSRMNFGALPDKEYESQIESVMPYINKLVFEDGTWFDLKEKATDLMERQKTLISKVKTECAFIEHSSTTQGHQRWDLPPSMRRLTGKERPRKDSYTALLLANWGWQCYRDMKTKTENSSTYAFMPFMI